MQTGNFQFIINHCTLISQYTDIIACQQSSQLVMRKMDAEAMRARTQQEAAVEAQSLKAERAESSAKKGKSLGEWLFGL